MRPKAMTVAVILAGLLPIMWGSGTGSEVMQRIAAPMVGGMITAPLLSMFVIPAAYLLMRRPRRRRPLRMNVQVDKPPMMPDPTGAATRKAVPRPSAAAPLRLKCLHVLPISSSFFFNASLSSFREADSGRWIFYWQAGCRP